MGVPIAPVSVLSRLWYSRARLIAAGVAFVTAVAYWHGWLGWAIGTFAAAGLVLFEFRRWWDYVARGEPESRQPQRRLSGSARFREPGTTAVRLVSVGEASHLVAMELRIITQGGEEEVARLMTNVPTTVTDHVSLDSAGHIVDSLRAAGAQAHVLVRGMDADKT
jgi:hypothetical protein